MWGNVLPITHCTSGIADNNKVCLSEAEVEGKEYQSETNVIRDIIPYVEENYRVIKHRKARALYGFSMGGFGVSLYSFKYPQRFGCAVSLDGALHSYETITGEEPEARAEVYTEFYGDNMAGWSYVDILGWAKTYSSWLQSADAEPVALSYFLGTAGTKFFDGIQLNGVQFSETSLKAQLDLYSIPHTVVDPQIAIQHAPEELWLGESTFASSSSDVLTGWQFIQSNYFSQLVE